MFLFYTFNLYEFQTFTPLWIADEIPISEGFAVLLINNEIIQLWLSTVNEIVLVQHTSVSR